MSGEEVIVVGGALGWSGFSLPVAGRWPRSHARPIGRAGRDHVAVSDPAHPGDPTIDLTTNTEIVRSKAPITWRASSGGTA